ACSIADETTDQWEFACEVHGWKGLTQSHFCKTFVFSGRKRIAQNHECINVLAPECRESSFEVGWGTGVRRVNFDTERTRSCVDAGQVGHGAGIPRVDENTERTRLREQLTHEPDLLLQELGGEEGGACDIASGPPDIRDEAQLNGIAPDAEYDRNGRAGRFDGGRCRAAERNWDRRMAGDQIRRKCRQLIILVRRADIQYDVVPDSIAALIKT